MNMETARIQDLPTAERPREKLAHFGPTALDNAELLALFIRTGTKGRSAIQIGRELLQKYGSIGALGRMPVTALAKEKGLGLAKASQLAAAFELGARVAREQVHQTALDSPDRIYDFLGPQLGHQTQEHLVVLLVDTRLHHAGTVSISMGTVNETIAHPRDILRPVLTHGAYGFILAHNHPSGDPRPSRADETMTRRIQEAAELMQLRFLDHVIIGRPSPVRQAWFSFREAGVIR
ncbi:hypothetical protein llg_03450 [Luteolibacter sp. LG18]|nr:hypothetical protein llg_03450 [Luteolibacter sp. LG18]